jgi:beta-aspartyl-peptidase (threonine type)
MRFVVHGGAGSGATLGRPTPERQGVLAAAADGVTESTPIDAIEGFETLTGSTAGVIVCGPDGVGSAHNGASTQVAVAER